MKIETVFAIDDNTNNPLALHIKFNTNSNIKIGNVVTTTFKKEKRYFKVYKVMTINQFQIECEAIACGYNRLDEDEIECITDLLDYELALEIDKNVLSRLRSYDEY